MVLARKVDNKSSFHLCANKGRPAAYLAFRIGVDQYSLGAGLPNDSESQITLLMYFHRLGG